jgi:hypothetical protein
MPRLDADISEPRGKRMLYSRATTLILLAVTSSASWGNCSSQPAKTHRMHHDEAGTSENGVEQTLSSATAHHATTCPADADVNCFFKGQHSMLVDNDFFTSRKRFSKNCATGVQKNHTITVECIQEEALSGTAANAKSSNTLNVHAPILPKCGQEGTTVETHSIMLPQVHGHDLCWKAWRHGNFLYPVCCVFQVQPEHRLTSAAASLAALAQTSHVGIQCHAWAHEEHGAWLGCDKLIGAYSYFQDLAELTSADLEVTVG